jgi:SAM-dependent methyltransferase
MRAVQSEPTNQGDRVARDSAYFDRWYSEMAVSAVRDSIVVRHLGVPESYAGTTGVLHWDALDEIASELRLPPGGDGVLVDVACGRGGYGVELARRTGARLSGVDFSEVALKQAELTAARHEQEARFGVGTLTETNLGSGTADALLCTDSVHFAKPPAAALAEFRRVLKSGGRLALTTWQPTRPKVQVPERLRGLDLRADLEGLGFSEIVVARRARWRSAERALFEAAVATPNDGDDLALASLQQEARQALEHFDDLQRIVVYATASGNE